MKKATLLWTVAFAWWSLLAAHTSVARALDARPELPSAVPLGEDDTRGRDRRLAAIAKNPSLLSRIDQRDNFVSQEKYDEELEDALAAARRVLPDIFSAINCRRMHTAVCVGDARVYFWLPLQGRSVLGWIPLDLVGFKKPSETMAIWSVEHNNGKASKSLANIALSSLPREADVIRQKLGEEFGVRLSSVHLHPNESGMDGVIDAGLKRSHAMSVMASGGLLEAHVSMRSDLEKISSDAAPNPMGRKFNNRPVSMDFWPPSDASR